MRRAFLCGLALTIATLSAVALMLAGGGTASPVAAISPIANIKSFLEQCPTTDPMYSQIRSDFEIRKDGAEVGALNCSQPISSIPIAAYTDPLIVVQGLRTIYYMEGGRHVSYPWTSGSLYNWMKSKIGGIDIRAGGSYCCETFNAKLFVVVGAQDDFNRDFDRAWRGIAGNIDLYAHEARHVDGFPHVSGCGITNGCDQTYDEGNLSPYGIQWWLNAQWLSGGLDVGYSCLSQTEVSDIAGWHLSSANSTFRDRFVDNMPPLLTMPSQPGGPCGAATPTPTRAPTPTPTSKGMSGDTDCDGEVDSVDALMVLRNTAGLPHSAKCIAAGDVDCDQDIDSVDALKILRYVAGLGNPVPPGCGPIGE